MAVKLFLVVDGCYVLFFFFIDKVYFLFKKTKALKNHLNKRHKGKQLTSIEEITLTLLQMPPPV